MPLLHLQSLLLHCFSLSFASLAVVGGLYFAILNEKSLKVEDLSLITLLPKTESFHEDLLELLQLVRDDLGVLSSGRFVSLVCTQHFGSQCLPLPGLLGHKVTIPAHNIDFTMECTLRIISGDLQGLPEIYFTRAPNAEDVSVSFLSLPLELSTS